MKLAATIIVIVCSAFCFSAALRPEWFVRDGQPVNRPMAVVIGLSSLVLLIAIWGLD